MNDKLFPIFFFWKRPHFLIHFHIYYIIWVHFRLFEYLPKLYLMWYFIPFLIRYDTMIHRNVWVVWKVFSINMKVALLVCVNFTYFRFIVFVWTHPRLVKTWCSINPKRVWLKPRLEDTGFHRTRRTSHAATTVCRSKTTLWPKKIVAMLGWKLFRLPTYMYKTYIYFSWHLYAFSTLLEIFS